MRKEQLIAIIFGSFLGIAVAFGIWRFARNKPQEPVPNPSNTQDAQTGVASGELNIVSPADNAVAASSVVTVSGLSVPNSTVAAYAKEVHVAKVDSAGSYSLEVELSAGINTVFVWSFEQGKPPQAKQLTIIHTTELNLDDPAKTAVALMGTVTDITKDNLQIRAKSGEIEQISVTSDTSYVLVNDETEELSFDDLALGDFVAALGARNAEDVMEAGRILVTTESQEEGLTAIAGTIEELSSSEFIVATHDGKQVSIDATGSVDIFSSETMAKARLSTAEPGDSIAILGTYEGDELVATTIILL